MNYFRKGTICFVLVVICINISYSQTIVIEESKVEFEIGSMGITSVDGTFSNMSGIVKLDKNNLKNSIFDVCIKASSINTDNEKRDLHLKNKDFFYIEKYANICFKSLSFHMINTSYVVKGKLTILDITKEIEIPFTVKEENNKLTYSGEIEINRFDFGLGKEAYSGTFMVGEIATLKIVCVTEN